MDDLQGLPATPDRPSRAGLLAFGGFAALTLPPALIADRGVMWLVGITLLATVVWVTPRRSGAGERGSDVAGSSAVPSHAAGESASPPFASCPQLAAGVPLELRALVGRLFEAARPSLDPSAVHVWCEDDASRSLRLLAAAGPLPPGPRPCALHDEPVGAACVVGEPRTARLARIRSGDDDGMLWRVALPLDEAEPRVVAAFDVIACDAPDASEAGAVLERFRLSLRAAASMRLAAVETSAARALVDALSLLDSASSPAEALELTLEGAMRVAGAATGSIMLSGGDRVLRVAASRGLAPGFESSEIPEGEGIAGWVAATRTPLIIEDQPGRDSRPRPSTGPSSISVPLTAGERLVGVLNVACRDYPMQPVGPVLSALAMLGGRAGSLLDSETSS